MGQTCQQGFGGVKSCRRAQTMFDGGFGGFDGGGFGGEGGFFP
jgi:hypothetical protein